MEEKYISLFELAEFIVKDVGGVEVDSVKKFFKNNGLLERYKKTNKNNMVKYEIPEYEKYVYKGLWEMHVKDKNHNAIVRGLASGKLNLIKIDDTLYDQIEKVRKNADVIVKYIHKHPEYDKSEEYTRNIVYKVLGILDIDKIVKICNMITMITDFNIPRDVNITEKYIDEIYNSMNDVMINYMLCLYQEFGIDSEMEYVEDALCVYNKVNTINSAKDFFIIQFEDFEFNNKEQEELFWEYADELMLE